jgi:hypothetical protein
MSIRHHVLFLLIAPAASACASEHSFKNEQEFASYVSKLGLSALTAPSAISKVTAEGFTCYPQKNFLYCVREVKGLVCNQKQIIGLPPPETNQIPLKVSTDFGLVCL